MGSGSSFARQPGQPVSHAQHKLAGAEDGQIRMAGLKVAEVERNQPGAALLERCDQDRQIGGIRQTLVRVQVGREWTGHHAQAAGDQQSTSSLSERHSGVEASAGIWLFHRLKP